MEKPLIHCCSGSGMRKGMLLSPLLCNTALEALANATENFESKRYKDWKGRDETVIFAVSIIFNLKKHTKSTNYRITKET